MQLARQAAWRLGASEAPDQALAEVALGLEDPNLAGPLVLTEATFAWRRGDSSLAVALAARAEGCFRAGRNPAGALLAGALQAGLSGDQARSAELARAAVERPLPDFDWQVLGLLLPKLPDALASWLEAAVLRAREAPRPSLRRELLSPEEALRALASENRHSPPARGQEGVETP